MNFVLSLALASTLSLITQVAAAETPTYDRVAPIFRTYCSGCHNSADREGGLSLETLADLRRGGENGQILVPGEPDVSRLMHLLLDQSDSMMPPPDEPRPSDEQIALVRQWIEAGAAGPAADAATANSALPIVRPAAGVDDAITAVAAAPDGSRLAIGRFGRIDVFDAVQRDLLFAISGLRKKVAALTFSADGKLLVLASGQVGIIGEAQVWDMTARQLHRKFRGHRDLLYDAELSPDATILATCSYDHEIILWDLRSGDEIRRLAGHNGAVYDLAFSPDGSVLASASGDETVKLWLVASGKRLDTLGQPEGEQYTVTFSPDGRFVLAGGADNRIRIWRFISRQRQRINPLLHSRFAHDGSVVCLAYSQDGRNLVSAGEDRSLKQWETGQFTETRLFERQPDVISSMAFSSSGDQLVVGRMDGSMKTYSTASPPVVSMTDPPPGKVPPRVASRDDQLHSIDEIEPNDAPVNAQQVSLPANIEATIHPMTGDQDADLFRFSARAGEQWVLEINGARRESPIDSKVEVLDSAGQPVARVLLQATRDSYFTFRGQTSDVSDGFRLHNWQEMELNQFLYCRGEVVKLWHYPRGPDSGFRLYPGRGKRHTFFDTTALAHALNETCYIVEPHPPGSSLIPNGLPVFRLYYENDDESTRRWGTDSKLTFTAPADGDYMARVTDVRGFGGPDYSYTLTIRTRQPDFNVTLTGKNPQVSPGSGKEFSVTAERIDGFDGEIRVEIEGLPPGFQASSPVVIEAGQELAYGVISADADAPDPAEHNVGKTRIVAKAQIDGRSVQKQVADLGEIKLAKPAVQVRLFANGDHELTDSSIIEREEPLQLTIAPGQTITAVVKVERHGFKGRIPFGKDESGRNLPHGVFVDNIGLNGLMIVEAQNQRKFFITAAPWVQETTRPFHLVAQVAGNQASRPVILHIRPSSRVAQADD